MALRDTVYNRMHGKVLRLSDNDILTVWRAFSDSKAWDGGVYGDGIPLNDWVLAIDTEMSRRGLPKD